MSGGFKTEVFPVIFETQKETLSNDLRHNSMKTIRGFELDTNMSITTYNKGRIYLKVIMRTKYFPNEYTIRQATGGHRTDIDEPVGA